MAYVQAAVAVIGLGLQVIGGKKKAKAEKKLANAVDANAALNAELLQNQADQEEMEARENLARQRDEGRRFMGTQRAIIASSGIVSSEGSALDVIGETAGRLALMEADAARLARARKKQGYAAADEVARTGELTASGYRAQSTATKLGTAASAFGAVASYGAAGVQGFNWAAPRAIPS